MHIQKLGYIPMSYFLRLSIGFSSLVLITGIYKITISGFLRHKLADAKKEKEEEEEAKKEISLEELKKINSALLESNKRLEDELRAARILAEQETTGYLSTCHAYVLCV